VHRQVDLGGEQGLLDAADEDSAVSGNERALLLLVALGADDPLLDAQRGIEFDETAGDVTGLPQRQRAAPRAQHERAAH